jgi:hypothetical protein
MSDVIARQIVGKHKGHGADILNVLNVAITIPRVTNQLLLLEGYLAL